MKTNTPLDHFVSMLKANQCLKSARLEHAVRAAPRQWFVDRMHTRSQYLRFIDVITLSELPGESWCLMLKLRKTKTHLTGEVVSLPGFMLFTGQYCQLIFRLK